MITYTGHTLNIDVEELLELLPDDEKLRFIETLSCTDAVIKHVADQIVDGATENGLYGARLCAAAVAGGTALDIAIRRVALAAPDVAAKEVLRLQIALERAEEERDNYLLELQKNRKTY